MTAAVLHSGHFSLLHAAVLHGLGLFLSYGARGSGVTDCSAVGKLRLRSLV